MRERIATFPKLITFSVIAALAAPVMAQQAGDTIVSAGWAHISPQDSSEPLKISGNAIHDSGAGVANADTLALQITHFLTDHFAITADMGMPPTFKLAGEGALERVGQIGTAKLWSPALLAKYYFGDAQSKFRPFVGVGAAYVWYSDIRTTDKFVQTLSGMTAGNTSSPTSVSLSNSLAPVANIGLAYNFDKNWSANFSVSYVKLKTAADLTTQTPAGPVYSTTKLTLDPIVTLLTVGYRF
ncbi:OmpW/AlkL family protein [Collimonas humicola]|uniref:OmpW/AlkL family protein n=1 Tax=Collimonas humicola TaxID=2825886 RepID=UPI001B8B1DFB|nr:OmpW family outer membrane protein [Collimonas humicola]